MAADYVRNHVDNVDGMIMLGSWIDDETNVFPTPFLAAMGTIDGNGILRFYLDVLETAALPESVQETSFSVVVDDVNHAQVSSGPMPESVTNPDIDAEVSDEEAHRRYGAVAADFIVRVTPRGEVLEKLATLQ